jgi:hypothetical protein
MKTIVSEIPNYKTFYKGEKTLEIGYPWLTFGAIMAIEKILEDSKGQFDILELGSGGSTIFFEKRCKSLLSLEDKPTWTKIVNEKLKSNKVICGHTKAQARIISRYPDGFFDLILIDGFSGGEAYFKRQRMIIPCLPKLKIGGWLVIDNYENLKFDYSNFDVYTFDMFRYSGRGTKLCKRLS